MFQYLKTTIQKSEVIAVERATNGTKVVNNRKRPNHQRHKLGVSVGEVKMSKSDGFVGIGTDSSFGVGARVKLC